MGMYAEIIAVGPFSQDIIEYLEYEEAYYKGTRTGAIINQTLFGIRQGTTVGHEFSACLGITDGWDFNQHKIDTNKINHPMLKDFIDRYTEYTNDYHTFIALLNKGFDFHFTPNG